MKALLTNYHQPPRKVRLVADLIRGKSIEAAHTALTFLNKKSAPAIVKLIDSAVSNAKSKGMDESDLFIKTIMVDKGLVMKRFRPFGRGRSGTLRKVMSIVKLELGSRTVALATKQAKEVAKEAKSNNVETIPTPKPKAVKKATKKTK